MSSNHEMTEHELNVAIVEIKTIENVCRLDIGRKLNEVKAKIDKGRFIEFVKTLDYTHRYATKLMKMDKLYNNPESREAFTKLEMKQLVEVSEVDRPVLETAISSLKAEKPETKINLKSLQKAHSILKSSNDAGVEELKRELAKPIKDIKPPAESVDWINGFAVHLKAAARMVWESDASAQDLARAIKLDHHARAKQETLKRTLTQVWEILEIGT